MNLSLNLSSGSAGTVIMDVAALFLLGGILVYTTLYRRRGRLYDKLFFAMTVITIIMAAVDGMNYLLLDSNEVMGAELMTAGDTIFFICFEAFPFLYVLYLDFRLHSNVERLQKRRLIYGIPLLFSVGMILLNLRYGFLFSVEKHTNSYIYGDYYNLVFLPALIYCVIVLFQFAQFNRKLIFLFLALILCRVLWGFWFRGISSTAFMFTIFLAYTHIYAMNRSLLDESSGDTQRV